MFLFRRRRHADFAREIQAHLDLETDRLVADGLSRDDARLAARRKFGSVLAAEERFHEARRLQWLDQLQKDLQVSLRALARTPIATLVAVLSFAGAIGAATTTLLVRDIVFYRPPQLYRSPSELSRVQTAEATRRAAGNPVPGPLFDAWKGLDTGATLAAATPGMSHEVRVRTNTVNLPVRSITPAFFEVLGVPAMLGKTISEPSASPSVVVSYRVWLYLFESRPDAIGEVMWIDNKPYTLAGVMPDRFWFASMEAQAWRLLDPGGVNAETRLEVVARRKPDVSHAQLAASLQRPVEAYAQGLPANERQVRIRVSGIEGTPMGNAVTPSFPWLLGACVLLTVLIACANVAILVIAQWTAREHEISIRAAIGASRRQIVRLLLTESLLLATLGGILGACVTLAFRGLLVWRGAELVRQFDMAIPLSLFLKAAIITMVTGIAAGAGPALLETRRLLGNPMQALRTAEGVRQRWRHALVIAEITVTVALLVVASGMVETYQRQLHGDVGYDTAPLLMTHVENPDGVPITRLAAALEAMPGVASVAAGTSLPFLGTGPLQRMAVDASGSNAVQAERAAIAPAFFSTLGVPMRRGRAFSAADTPAARVVIVNETLAGRLWHERDPLGQRMWIEGEAYDVVGVVADYRNTALENRAFDAKVFVPLAAGPGVKSIDFLIRAADPPIVLRDVRTVVRNAAPGNAAGNAFTLTQIITVASQEILVGTAVPLVPLIGTAMFLTAAGIYGVLVFAISRRSHELAVRVAMGATGRDLVRLVSAHSLRLVGTGAVLGLGATFALSRVVRAAGGAGGMLDPSPRGFIIPAVIIFITAAVATLVPSRRAARVSPNQLLRTP